MTHPYTNQALSNSMMLVPKVKMMPLDQKQRLLEKCKFIYRLQALNLLAQDKSDWSFEAGSCSYAKKI